MKIETIDISGVVLETERLILRQFENGDLADFNAYAKVDGVGECAGWKHHESLEESKQILDMFVNEHRTFAIVDKSSGKVIGSVGIEKTDENSFGKEITEKNVNEAGYVLAKDYWGRGLMTEAVREVIAFMFKTLNCDFVTCCHFLNNDRSRRVIEKCGFEFYGECEYHSCMGPVFQSKGYVLSREKFFKSTRKAQ